MPPPYARRAAPNGPGTCGRRPSSEPGGAPQPPPAADSLRLRRSEHAVERRPREDLRPDVVQVEVDLRQGADVLADVVVHGDDGLDPELKILPEPDDAGIDRPGRTAGIAPI